jgi:hypothetical protein
VGVVLQVFLREAVWAREMDKKEEVLTTIKTAGPVTPFAT